MIMRSTAMEVEGDRQCSDAAEAGEAPSSITMVGVCWRSANGEPMKLVDLQVFSEITTICRFAIILCICKFLEGTTIPTWKSAYFLVDLQIFCAIASF